MSLVKSRKRSLPVLGESFMGKEAFFNNLLDSPIGLLDLDPFFNRVLNSELAMPAINIKEQEKTIELELAAPGLSKADFNITLDNGILSISSQKEQKEEEEKEGYVRKEFSYNSFSRSFSLPETVDEEKDVKASYRDGILKLVLTKKENLKPKLPKSVKVS